MCVWLPPLQAGTHAKSLTQKGEKQEKKGPAEPSSSTQQSLLQPDVPVVLTGVQEHQAGAREDPEQEEELELEFPHDLLPSLDFSSELNIWEASLG